MRSGEIPALAVTVALAVAFLSVIPSGNLLFARTTRKRAPHVRIFGRGRAIDIAPSSQLIVSLCHSPWDPASSVAVACPTGLAGAFRPLKSPGRRQGL